MNDVISVIKFLVHGAYHGRGGSTGTAAFEGGDSFGARST
jgi:hypothetical protein